MKKQTHIYILIPRQKKSKNKNFRKNFHKKTFLHFRNKIILKMKNKK